MSASLMPYSSCSTIEFNLGRSLISRDPTGAEGSEVFNIMHILILGLLEHS